MKHDQPIDIQEMTFHDFCESALSSGLTLTELLAELVPERASLELLE